MCRQRGASWLLASSLTLISLARAGAWEADVHYGLTKWLALQAGFPKDQAGWIADGNLGTDNSSLTDPVHGTLSSACFGGQDPVGAGQVQENHFPAKGAPPAQPGNRMIAPGKVWFQGNLRQPPSVILSQRGTLVQLGNYLHALQDSWSHAGQPDIPPVCDPELAWGHAIKRGGWSCHLADVTYRWRDTDVPKMAEASYQALVAALKKKPRTPWKILKPKVDEFASARTKWAKDAWFRKENIDDRSFLQAISPPDCAPGDLTCTPYPFEQLIESFKLVVDRDRKQQIDAPPDILNLFRNFFSAVRQQFLSTLQYELIDERLAELALAEALHVNTSCPKLLHTLFASIVGQAFVDGRGAHQPLAVCELAAKLRNASDPISCDEAAALAQKAIDEASPRGPGLRILEDRIAPTPPFTYKIRKAATAETYYAFGRFIHLPRDLLLVRAQRLPIGPRITAVIWAPNE